VRVFRSLSILALALLACPLLFACATYLDVEALTVFLKHSAGELAPIISDDTVWDLEPTDD
jgi:hypothetical protein